MPCSDNGYPRGREVDESDYQVMTRLSCEYCTMLDNRGSHIPGYAASWWNKHKQRDEERLENSKRERQQDIIRESALSKLSAEEREELGL